jgi:hypothetical protein
MSLIKLFLGGNNLVFSRPERVWSVTSRLGTGKWLTLFYSVCSKKYSLCTCALNTAKREGYSQQSGPLNISWFGDYSSYFYHSKKDIYDIKVCGDLAKFF